MLQISRILACECEFTVSSLESLNEKIEDYLQGVSNILPQMLQKVKTHLSVHVVSVIYLYHIPSSYTVDSIMRLPLTYSSQDLLGQS